MSGARGGRQGAAAARKLPSGGSSSGSQVFVSLPDLYRVGPSSAVSKYVWSDSMVVGDYRLGVSIALSRYGHSPVC